METEKSCKIGFAITGSASLWMRPATEGTPRRAALRTDPVPPQKESKEY